MDYGRGIRIVRAARGWSQRTLAERARISPSYLSLVESGMRTPSLPRIEGIAEGLGVPVFLLALLAADRSELQFIDEGQASRLGGHLLDVLLASEGGRDPSAGKDTDDVG